MITSTEDKIRDLNERIRGLSVVIKVLLKKDINPYEYIQRKKYLQECRVKLMNGFKANKYREREDKEGNRPWYLRPAFQI